MPYTLGFFPALLTAHFHKHKGDFGVATEREYEALADTFLGEPPKPEVEEGIRRSNRDLIRYNRVTHEFAVLGIDQYIRTYFKADPAIHKQPTNYDYFLAECLK